MSEQERNKNAWLGIVLVVIGGFFLMRNFDWIPYWFPRFLFGWEMILILIGGAMVVTGRREGFIPMAIGGFFILDDIFWIPHLHIGNLWPIILIIIGISIFIRRRRDDQFDDVEKDADFFDDTAIFGGSERSFSSKNFKGGKITSVFGGSDIDFTQADLGSKEVVIDQFCLFGGNALRVPGDWTVINDSFVIFGGFADKRRQADRDPEKVLRIKGSVIFGGSEVKS